MSESTAVTRRKISARKTRLSASVRKTRVESIKPLKCCYCTRRFFGVGSYCKHVKSHEKRYRKHWMARSSRNHGRSGENIEQVNDGKGGSDKYPNVAGDGLGVGLSQSVPDNLGLDKKDKYDTIAIDNGTAKSINTDLVLSINKDKVYVYLVYPKDTHLCNCNKESQPHSMPCDCELLYKRQVYDSIHQMHQSMKAGVGYSCSTCKIHVTQDNKEPSGQVNVSSRCRNCFTNHEDLQKHRQVCAGRDKDISLECSNCRDTFANVEDFQTHSQACIGHDDDGFTTVANTDTLVNADTLGNVNSLENTAELATTDTLANGDGTDNTDGNSSSGGVKIIEFMQCTVCGCSCQDLASLNEHLESHVKPKIIQTDESTDIVPKKNLGFTLCTVCGCHCEDNVSLNEHLKSHANATLGNLDGPAGKITVVWKDQVVDSSSTVAMNVTNQIGCTICGAANGCTCAGLTSTLFKIAGSTPPNVSTRVTHPKTEPMRRLMLPITQVQVPFKYACPICKMKFITMKELEEHKVAMHFTKHKKIAPAAAKGAIILPIPVSIARTEVVQSKKGKGNRKKSVAPPSLTADHLYSVLQHRNRKWKCGDCPEAFKTRDDLRLHVASEHRSDLGLRWSKKWLCDVCDEVFPSRDKWKGHQRVHKGQVDKGTKRNWLCPLCGFYFEKEVYLVAHRKAEHPEASPESRHSYIDVPFAAFNKETQKTDSPTDAVMETEEDTDETDASEDENPSNKKKKMLMQDAMGDLAPLIVETMDTTEDAKWKCHICNSTFKCRDDLRLHIRLKHKGGFKTRGKEWQCLVCKLLLPTRDRWKSHGKMHKGEQRGSCSECGIYFESHAKFNSHLKRVHGTGYISDENLYMVAEEDESVAEFGNEGWLCTLCSMKCKNHQEFQEHIRSVHKIVEEVLDEHWPCLECSSAFGSFNDLHKHVESKHGTGKQWQCATCGSIFDGSAKLREHMEDHTPTCTAPSKTNLNRWVCSECGEIFDTRDELRLHRKDHLRKANHLKCSLCGWVYSTEAELDHHLQNHMVDFEELKCRECSGVFFSTVDNLKTHLKVHKDWCQLCGFKFTLLHSKEKHVQVCALEGLSKDFGENSKCPECGEDFQKSVQFRLHMARHAVKREKLKCKICGKLFQNIREVVQHKQASHRMDCHMCLKRFDTEGQLSDHLETHVACLYCHKKFDSYSSCKRHIESYCHALLAVKGMAPRTKFPSVPIGHRVKKVPVKCECYCDQCGKKFNTKEAMKTHRIVHFRGKFATPTKCPDCDKTFNYETQLRMHKRAVHWPEKPFPCIYCQQRFKTSDELFLHDDTHTKDKPHMCPMCPRRFKCKNGVKYHLNTHTGLKPFKCTYCAKTFGQPGQRKTHERRHEGLRPYKCSVCECAYTYGPSLKIHLKTHIRKGELDKLPDVIRSEVLQAGVKARNEATKAAKRERIQRAKEAKERGQYNIPSAEDADQVNQEVAYDPVVATDEGHMFEVVAQAVMAAERSVELYQQTGQSDNAQTVFPDNLVVQVQTLDEVQATVQHHIVESGNLSQPDQVIGHHDQVVGHRDQVAGHQWQQVWPQPSSVGETHDISSQVVAIEEVGHPIQMQHESDAAATLYNMTQR